MFEGGARLGLISWLFFRDLDPLNGAAPAAFGGRRTGEGSREGLGELVSDGVGDRRGAGSGVVEARFKVGSVGTVGG